jgi:hypothetical protein
MSMIYDLQYIVNHYMPSTHMWREIQYELEATDYEMEEAFEEISESMAGDLESDVEVMAGDWMDRHGCAYEDDFRSAVEKLVAERLDDDD